MIFNYFFYFIIESIKNILNEFRPNGLITGIYIILLRKSAEEVFFHIFGEGSFSGSNLNT